MYLSFCCFCYFLSIYFFEKGFALVFMAETIFITNEFKSYFFVLLLQLEKMIMEQIFLESLILQSVFFSQEISVFSGWLSGKFSNYLRWESNFILYLLAKKLSSNCLKMSSSFTLLAILRMLYVNFSPM